MIKSVATALFLSTACISVACPAELTVPTKAHSYVSQSNPAATTPQDERSKASTIDRGSSQKKGDPGAKSASAAQQAQ